VVGGGYSGVEAAGEIYSLIHKGIRPDYPWVDYGQVRLALVEGLPDILPEIDPALREVGRRRLMNLGVEVRTGDFVSEVTPEGLSFQSGELIPARTVLWSAGGRGSAVLEGVNAEKDKMNRLVVDEHLSLPEHEDVWALGDAASAPGPEGDPVPPTAQAATQQTSVVAHNVFASLTEGEPERFEYKPLGQLIEVGGAFALSEVMGWKLSGAFGHALSRAVHLQRLNDRQKRARVLADWLLDAVFRPDTSDLGRV
jgi:NADH dehydrogenase